jgi:aconitate hydratase 2/2-methylisocitrate dehydratase
MLTMLMFRKDIRMIRLDHFLLRRSEKVDLGFVGSCMVHKGDLKILSKMLQNIDEQYKVEFKAPLVVAPPTYNIVDELKAEGDWEVLQKYSGFEFDDNAPKE